MLTKLESLCEFHLEHNSPFWAKDHEILAGLYSSKRKLLVIRSISTESWPAFDCTIDITQPNQCVILDTEHPFYIGEDDFMALEYTEPDEKFFINREGFYRATSQDLQVWAKGKYTLKE